MKWTHDNDKHLIRQILPDPLILSQVYFKFIYIWWEKGGS